MHYVHNSKYGNHSTFLLYVGQKSKADEVIGKDIVSSSE